MGSSFRSDGWRKRPARRLRLLSHEPQVGDLRNWAGLDIVHGALYPKLFTLRGLGNKIEVWVATGRRTFAGASAIPGRPVDWTVAAAPPNGGPPALYTGAGNNLDRTIVRPLSVPAAGGNLAFEAQWNVEEDATSGWDFTFVQVSTDGGMTYRSIACTSSRSDASPLARPVMHANLSGYTAYSGGGWRNGRCDLRAFAGRSILLAFRHVTDGSIPGDPDDPTATIPPGFWIRNVTLGGSPVADGASLAGWLSPSQARPTPVHGFTLQLVGYQPGRRRCGRHVRRADGARHGLRAVPADGERRPPALRLDG